MGRGGGEVPAIKRPPNRQSSLSADHPKPNHNQTALMTAAEAGQLGAVRIVLSAAKKGGVEIDAQDFGGHTVSAQVG